MSFTYNLKHNTPISICTYIWYDQLAFATSHWLCLHLVFFKKISSDGVSRDTTLFTPGSALRLQSVRLFVHSCSDSLTANVKSICRSKVPAPSYDVSSASRQAQAGAWKRNTNAIYMYNLFPLLSSSLFWALAPKCHQNKHHLGQI